MVVPVIEGQVLDQRLQMFEEGLSRRQSILHGVVRGINPVQGGVRPAAASSATLSSVMSWEVAQVLRTGDPFIQMACDASLQVNRKLAC